MHQAASTSQIGSSQIAPLCSPTYLPSSNTIPNTYSHIHLPPSSPFPYTSNPINFYFKQYVAELNGKCEKPAEIEEIITMKNLFLPRQKYDETLPDKS